VWRYILAGLVGAVIGAGALLAVGLTLGEPESTTTTPRSTALCDDALTRRRNAEQVLTQGYTPPANPSQGTCQ
jgi:hypothetical protein